MKKIIMCILIALTVITCSGCSASSTDHFEEALKYIEAGDRDKAIDELNKAIEADPNNAELYIKRAYATMIISEKGLYEIDIEEVLADLQKALELDPENEEAMQLIYYAKVMKNDYEDAADTLEELIGSLDVSDETKTLLENAKAGNVKDLSGRVRTQTNYLNGALSFKTYFDCGKDGRYSKVRSYDANDKLIGEVDVTYDERGNRLTWVSFTEDGQMYRSEYVFDDQDRVKEYTDYRMDGSQYARVTYEYDEKGNEVRVVHDYGGSIQDFRNEFDKDGYKVSSYIYDENGELLYYYLLTYDEYGRQGRTESYNKDGELSYYLDFYYDEQGKQTGYARFDKDGNLVFERKED